MELVERYVYEVSRYLPPNQADDVAAELRSLLTETVEARSAESGRPADESLIVEVLRGFGEPDIVADRYREPRSLISPRLFPSFEYVAWIVVVVTAVSSLIGLAARGPSDWGGVLWAFVVRTFTGLGIAVVVYAVIDRLMPSAWTREDIDSVRPEWDPRTLPAVPVTESEVVTLEDVGGSFWELGILLVLLNAAPWLFGIPWSHQYQWDWVPLTTLGVSLPVVALNVYWGSRLVLLIVLAHGGRWTKALRWAELAIGVAGAVIAAVMLATFEPASPLPGGSGEVLPIHRIVKAGLWFTVAWCAWLTLTRLWSLLAAREELRGR